MAEVSRPDGVFDGGEPSFVAAEHDVLAFWRRERIFERSLEATRDGTPYIFYDGPPFATGLPHHGHLVASTLKDIIPRYFTMKGRYVQRRFGWDCHGLPVEHEIDKRFDLPAQAVVERLGVKGYNDACRDIVQRYTSEWAHTIERLGRWVDFEHDYKTMDAWFMESVWWVVRQLWDAGLIYQGVKVVPVSTALATTLSNFEAGLNYQLVQDPAITVLAKLQAEDAYLALWTTTPWTLPANLAICVGADIDYVKVYDHELGHRLYLAAERLEHYGVRHEIEILERVKGRDLAGLRYQPLFPYFADQAALGAFQVVTDAYVTADEGTGLVHQAPAFGEDDFRVLEAHGIDAFACPVTLEGRFTDEVTDFVGAYVKDADRDIVRHLKATGSLYEQDVVEHSYPYCYRSDTPLIYRAIPSWYVAVERFKDRLVAINERIHWVPEHIKQGRFGNWLAGARDWAISRNRVWGTPLPIWVNDTTGSMRCMGSREELARYTGIHLDDLHREHVDPQTFEIEGEAGTYRRVEEVLDCWFESGSMPYAQLHYPFENQALFERGFPAEFIAEGLDQTRGWFYTLTVLAAALYDQPAFNNVVVNGMVMAADGKKMSKRLKNYTPPDELMEIYGADALRLYYINSPLVRADEQRFRDDGVRDMVRRALLPWYNAWNFLATYAAIDGWSPAAGVRFGDNILDRWLLSRLQTLKTEIAREMAGYRLYNVVPQLFRFIEELTNGYIRLNRQRFWASGMEADKLEAYSALHTCVLELAQTMAPFAPFLSETLYRALRDLDGSGSDRPESVHLCAYPEPDPARIDPELERAVDRMQQVVLLGRQKREENKLGLRQPLPRLTIIHRDESLLADLRALERYIRSELNVKRIEYSSDEAAFIRLYARPNFRRLGRRLGKRMKHFQALIGDLDPPAIERFQSTGRIELEGETFGAEDIEILREAREHTEALSNRLISIDLDCAPDAALVQEGYAREIVNRIQRARKKADLRVADRIEVRYTGDQALLQAWAAHATYIAQETLTMRIASGVPDAADAVTAQIDGMGLTFSLRVTDSGSTEA